MKKLILIFLTMALSSSLLFSQNKSTISVHAGYLDPKDTDTGMTVGAMLLSSFDEAVDIGFGFDVFQRSYSRDAEVANGQIGDTNTTTKATQVDYQRTAIPLYLLIKIKIPAVRSRNFGYLARANLSYQFLISQEKNYEANKSETRRYKGLGWQIGGGLFYKVGSKSTLFAEALYNTCTVSRDISQAADQLPLTERVNLSGPGLRVGVELELR